MAESTDDALQVALAQFNDGLKAQQAEERAQRAIDKADRKKQQAAAELKTVQGNPKSSAEEKAAADAAYREAVDAWTRMKSGEPEPDQASAPDKDGAEADAETAKEEPEAAEDEAGEEPEAPEGEEPEDEAGEEPEAEEEDSDSEPTSGAAETDAGSEPDADADS